MLTAVSFMKPSKPVQYRVLWSYSRQNKNKKIRELGKQHITNLKAMKWRKNKQHRPPAKYRSLSVSLNMIRLKNI